MLINCPEEQKFNFGGLDVKTSAKGVFDCVIIFVSNEKELKEFLPKNQSKVNKDGKMWVTYPKKSGDIFSDLTRDSIWKYVNELKMNPNKIVSLDANWSMISLVDQSALRKESKFGQDPPGVDRTTKTVIPPKDLQVKLDENPKANGFFESLAFSHKREYVGWIHNAKKEETRDRRIKKTIELLLEGKKK